MPAIAIIPARYASTRFPGKPLASETGKPLIQHVVEQTLLAKSIEQAVVATDDQRIFDAVQAFGGRVVMTGEHPNGTSRIAEAVASLSTNQQPDIIVNVQGDEPEIEPELIDAAIHALERDEQADMSTLASSFAPDEDPADPNIVKVVISQQNRAMYFSRSLIPFHRDPSETPQTPQTPQTPGMPNAAASVLKHPGLYAYRPAFLKTYIALHPTPLEQIEKLEQLRVLEHGYTIAVARVDARHHGIDTPEQYEDFVRRLKLSTM